jgi:hypothetical protein
MEGYHGSLLRRLADYEEGQRALGALIAMSEDEMDAQREAALDIDEPIPDVPNDPYPLQADDPQPKEPEENPE